MNFKMHLPLISQQTFHVSYLYHTVTLDNSRIFLTDMNILDNKKTNSTTELFDCIRVISNALDDYVDSLIMPSNSIMQ